MNGDTCIGVDKLRPLFGVRPAVPWELQEQSPSWRSDVPSWRPPKHLLQFHRPVLVASLWQRLMTAVREPVRIWSADDDGRIVEVLCTARVRRHRDGTLSVQLRDLGDEGFLQWVDALDDKVMLTGMPVGFMWLDLLRKAALVEIVQNARRLGIPRTGDVAGAYAHELFEHFRRRLLRHADLPEMRRKVAAALELDLDAVRIARRLLSVPTPPYSGIRLAEYNTALRHKSALIKLEREMPQLVPLYAAVAGRDGFSCASRPHAS